VAAADLAICRATSGGKVTASFPVCVTSFEILMRDSKALCRYQWKYIVVDEGHRLKNSECKLLRELRTIPADNKLLLTGEAGQRSGKRVMKGVRFLSLWGMYTPTDLSNAYIIRFNTAKYILYG
jgi:hypothetical protein